MKSQNQSRLAFAAKEFQKSLDNLKKIEAKMKKLVKRASQDANVQKQKKAQTTIDKILN